MADEADDGVAPRGQMGVDSGNVLLVVIEASVGELAFAIAVAAKVKAHGCIRHALRQVPETKVVAMAWSKWGGNTQRCPGFSDTVFQLTGVQTAQLSHRPYPWRRAGAAQRTWAAPGVSES